MDEQDEAKDIGERAEEIYRSSLRDTLEKPEYLGKLVSIDVESSDYELGNEGDLEATQRLRKRRPSAQIFGLRIGYRTAYAVGGIMEKVER